MSEKLLKIIRGFVSAIFVILIVGFALAGFAAGWLIWGGWGAQYYMPLFSGFSAENSSQIVQNLLAVLPVVVRGLIAITAGLIIAVLGGSLCIKISNRLDFMLKEFVDHARQKNVRDGQGKVMAKLYSKDWKRRDE